MKITFNDCNSLLTIKDTFPEENISSAFVLSNDADYVLNLHFVRFKDSITGFKNTLFIVISAKSGLGFTSSKELFDKGKLSIVIDTDACVFKYGFNPNNIMTIDSNENTIRITLGAMVNDEVGNSDIMLLLKTMKNYCNPEVDHIDLSIEFPTKEDESRKELN